MAIPDQHFTLGDVSLRLGGSLAAARLAYVTLGRLNAAGDNAVLVLHGYTSSHRFVLDNDPDNAEGSWGPLIGPGKAIDTERYFVIAPNALGSSYGSTGPGDLNPNTGKRWGPDFPELTFEDQIDAQLKLLDSLGVSKLHAIVGLSMGGFGAFQWAIQNPTMARKIIPVLSAPWGSLNQAASHQGVTAVLQASAHWHGGWYYEHPQQMQQTLESIRIKTLERYGVPAWLHAESQDANQVQLKLQEMAKHWATRFDANAMLTLRAAINRFDVRDKLREAKAELMYVLCRTDNLFAPSIKNETMARWAVDSSTSGRPGPMNKSVDTSKPNAPNRAKYVEIDSAYGHFASSLDWHKWSDELMRFMNH